MVVHHSGLLTPLLARRSSWAFEAESDAPGHSGMLKNDFIFRPRPHPLCLYACQSQRVYGRMKNIPTFDWNGWQETLNSSPSAIAPPLAPQDGFVQRMRKSSSFALMARTFPSLCPFCLFPHSIASFAMLRRSSHLQVVGTPGNLGPIALELSLPLSVQRSTS